MFRFVVAVLAIVGVVALVSNGIGPAAAGFGLLLIPLLIFAKIAFFVFLFGALGRMFWYGGRRAGDGGYPDRRPGWRPARPPETPAKTPEQTFEEWHRLAHAREEVDSWAPPFPDTGENA